jgi:5,10-methylenetetrahydromethanopterin reductase
VTASAALTLQVETNGRAVLGVGRGDSALTQIGRHPGSANELEEALVTLQAYLRGDEVELEGAASRIRWAGETGKPKVPVAVATTGPHVIAAGARHAELLDFTVGAEPDRLRWAIETARAAAGDREVSLGAFVNLAVHPDRAVARDLVRGSTAVFARFATEGAPADGLSDVTRMGIERLAADYDEERQGHAGRAPRAAARGRVH